MANCGVDAPAVSTTVVVVNFTPFAGDWSAGADVLSVEPSVAAAGPLDVGATGVAGLAELHASAQATSADTPNRTRFLRFIQLLQVRGYGRSGGGLGRIVVESIVVRA